MYEKPTYLTSNAVQESEYYAFGLNVNRLDVSPANKYLYNGKELQNDYNLNQYDYGARSYDPVVGRWGSVDPLVENGQESTSPYGYVFNNPIKLTDPDGRFPCCGVFLQEPVSTTIAVGEAIYAGLQAAGIVATAYVGYKIIANAHAGDHDYSAPRDATSYSNNIPKIAPAIVKANGTFGDKKDTESKTDREGLRNAKDRNGIHRSQQPDRTIKPNTPEWRAAGLDERSEVEHEYTNSEGKKVVIRKDKPYEYKDGGKGDQGKHYNAGEDPKTQKDLNQHHNVTP